MATLWHSGTIAVLSIDSKVMSIQPMLTTLESMLSTAMPYGAIAVLSIDSKVVSIG